MASSVAPTRIGWSFAECVDDLKKAVYAAIVFAICLSITLHAPREGALAEIIESSAVAAVFFFIFAVSGFFVLYMLFRAVRRSNVGRCPDCAVAVRGLPGSGAVAFLVCPGCARYLQREGAQLHHVDDDCVWKQPVFETYLPRPTAVFASSCCVCAAPETRRLPCAWSYSVAPSNPVTGLRVPKHFSDSLDAPYCAEHADGVSVTQGEPVLAVIAFRSYPALREFCRANRTKPGSFAEPPPLPAAAATAAASP